MKIIIYDPPRQNQPYYTGPQSEISSKIVAYCCKNINSDHVRSHEQDWNHARLVSMYCISYCVGQCLHATIPI